jgi:signal transduction histidine kinase
MRPLSLRFRLIAAWVVFVVLILQASALGLRLLFERSITSKIMTELSLDLSRLMRGIDIADGREVKLLDTPTDPQYLSAHGGRYWQVSYNGTALRSPSLWKHELAVVPNEATRLGPRQIQTIGPDDQALVGMARTITVGEGDRRSEVHLVAAINDADIQAAINGFSLDLYLSLAALSALLLMAAAAHVTIGLRPLHVLKDRLQAIRSGEIRRLEGEFPSEVMPLIAETNALLEAQDEALDLARTRASNLAHGLKTPLAVMATHSRHLRRRGDDALADAIDRQVEAMRRHVERELARTRARATGTARYRRIESAPIIAEIASALQHLPKGQTIKWQIAVAEPLRLAVDRADFFDIMANLLDNGQKWARSRIQIDGRSFKGRAIFTVDDDGPGVADEDFARILQRGERADTTIPGTGLGLAIVNDLVLLYGGKLELAHSALGGLRAAVELPYNA